MIEQSIEAPINEKLIIERTEEQYLRSIELADSKIREQYKKTIKVDNTLTRKIVSFQANKNRPFYRWFKYKEGFSAELVQSYIRQRGIENSKTILDPFAGSGAALFVASEMGINSTGIELLPIGVEIIKVRDSLKNEFSVEELEYIHSWAIHKPWTFQERYKDFEVLRITNGAYPEITDKKIRQYLASIEEESSKIQSVLRLALLCILEDISFTRKDGQYLRWDHRAGRGAGTKPFYKGIIKNFDDEVVSKIMEIISDAKSSDIYTLFEPELKREVGEVHIIEGSCLEKLPNLEPNSFDMVITSPPYCNRYDYTRTYALELSLLGTDETQLLKLRQQMLSCTVENREKDLIKLNRNWRHALSFAENHELLQLILEFLEYKKTKKTINNNGIPRMIRGYFYEMACVIYDLFRVLKKGGQVIMVNDNVRYAGASISVDLILSDLANKIGFEIQEISVLPVGKGNSSQQMGSHGRESLRKCVYIWRKND